MNARRSRFPTIPAVLIAGAAVLAFLACLDTAAVPLNRSSPRLACAPQSAVGTWVVVAPIGPLVDRAPIVQIDTSFGRGYAISVPMALDPFGRTDSSLLTGVLSGEADKCQFRLTWQLRAPAEFLFQLEISADTARGTVVWRPPIGDSSQASGVAVRIDPAVLLSFPPHSLTSTDTTKAYLMFSLPDAPLTDRPVISQLRARGLVAELAIPTMLVGQVGTYSWTELTGYVREGFVASAHSRRHSPSTTTPLDFINEVAGSKQDLIDHGMEVRSFTQPGVWRDSLYFNSASKIRTWHGALLREMYGGFEAYSSGPYLPVPMVDSVAFGMSHITLDGLQTDSAILRFWKVAPKKGRLVILAVHTRSLVRPDQLTILFDSVAAAVSGGRVIVIPSRDAVPRSSQ